MRRRVVTALFLSIAALSLTALPVLAQNKYRLKPGATGKICLECHVAFEETMQLPFVHTPVEAGDCSDCHNPHASTHGKLLAADADKICLECHDGIAPAEPKSAHQAVLTGNCVTCHDPHASKNENILLRAGNELCYGCHQEIAAAIEAAEFKHGPVEDGCLNCHTAHASSESDALLIKSDSGLCTECHDPTNSFFIRSHMNYPVAGARCTACHDPHGSDNSGILWANVHRPVTNKMCNQCHEDASSPDALRTKKSGMDLCRGCHSSEVNRVLARKRIHWPLLDQTACLNCHDPHATREAALLNQPTKLLCGGCHEDTIRRQESSSAKHEPMEEGSCGMCHAPHASDNTFLLREANVIELCSTCHDWEKHSSHPIGEQVVDGRNPNLTLDCLTCHRSHGTEHKAFSHYDPSMELCVQCHTDHER